jgi:5-(carboxyamino)imidazole ribonucleotide synthase
MTGRIGIIGGGQLGRMMGFAAKRLGFQVTVIDPTPNSPAGQVVDTQIVADFKDEQAIRQLAKDVDVLTFEIELANAAILDELIKKGVTIHPSPATLTIIKDKFLQKEFLKKAGLPVAAAVAVETKVDIEQAAENFGYPLLLKARHDAYDGRGNALIKKPTDIDSAMEKLVGRSLYVEKFVPFVKELAVMVARSTTGQIKAYPVVETIHQNNICHIVHAPANVSEVVQQKAQKLAKTTMKQLGGAGVFGIEMFVTAEDKVLINEIAPRVHNSGHYTMEACVIDQFEQHIRAITGLPLGDTSLLTPAACMINILGERQAPAAVTGLDKVMKSLPRVSVHIYGKAETKPERKMGHITALDATAEGAYRKAKRARKYITI